MTAELRFATVDGERTALYIVGQVPPAEADDGEGHVIIALPFAQEHQGSWTAFEAKTEQGHTRQVRFSRMAWRQRNGVRRAPPYSEARRHDLLLRMGSHRDRIRAAA